MTPLPSCTIYVSGPEWFASALLLWSDLWHERVKIRVQIVFSQVIQSISLYGVSFALLLATYLFGAMMIFGAKLV